MQKNLKTGFVCAIVAVVALTQSFSRVNADKDPSDISEIAAQIEKSISEMGAACKKFTDRVAVDKTAVGDSEQAFIIAEPFENRIDALYLRSISVLSQHNGELSQDAALQIGSQTDMLFDGISFRETMIANAAEIQNGPYVKGPMRAAIRLLSGDSLNPDQIELLMAKIPATAVGKAYRCNRQLLHMPKNQRDTIGRAMLWRLAVENGCSTESVAKSLGVKI